jgi:hypothetical protein
MNNLTKKELLTIISKMKKQELLDIIQIKYGQIKYGGDNLVSRTPIKFKQINNNKNKNNNNVMGNDSKYNNMYVENIQ